MSIFIHSTVMKIDRLGVECGVFRPPLESRHHNVFDVATSMSTYIGASGAWNRKLVDIFGPIKDPNVYEDLIMCFRAKLLNEIYFIDGPLVRYRCEGGMSTPALEADSVETRKQVPVSSRIRNGVKNRAKRHSFHVATYNQRLRDVMSVRLPLGEYTKLCFLLGMKVSLSFLKAQVYRVAYFFFNKIAK